jgi:hypothetical protein
MNQITAETTLMIFIILTVSCHMDFINPFQSPDKSLRADSLTSIHFSRRRSRRAEHSSKISRTSSFNNDLSHFEHQQLSLSTASDSLSEILHTCEASQLRAYKQVVAAAQNLLIRTFLFQVNRCRQNAESNEHENGWRVRLKVDGSRAFATLEHSDDLKPNPPAPNSNDFSRMELYQAIHIDSSKSSFGRWDHNRGVFVQYEDAREAITHARNIFLLDDVNLLDSAPKTPATPTEVEGNRTSEDAKATEETLEAPPPSPAHCDPIDARRWRASRVKWHSAAEQRAAAELAAEVWAGTWDAAALLRRHRATAAAAAAAAVKSTKARDAARAKPGGRAGEKAAGGAEAGDGALCLDVLAGLSDGVLRASARIDGLLELQVRPLCEALRDWEGSSSDPCASPRPLLASVSFSGLERRVCSRPSSRAVAALLISRASWTQIGVDPAIL